MRLTSIPFYNIKNGNKTIEIRLFDEKRKNLRIGDNLIFNLKDSNENIKTKIINLKQFENFEKVYLYYPVNKYEKNHKNIKSAVDSMYKYYSKEDEEKFGVIVIEFKITS